MGARGFLPKGATKASGTVSAVQGRQTIGRETAGGLDGERSCHRGLCGGGRKIILI
jgi:hypothetical protein